MKNQPLLTADLGGLAKRIDYTRYKGDLATYGNFRIEFVSRVIPKDMSAWNR
jgi:hypothetical protein